MSSKKSWKQFLSNIPERFKTDHEYVYPVLDHIVNKNLDKQDKGKKNREQKIYTEYLDFQWEVAIDFGCGIGKNFSCFDSEKHRTGLLLGIEPDKNRAAFASDRATLLKYLETIVVCSDIELLEKIPDELKADLILCSQVLGHVSRDNFNRIIKGFAQVLCKGGRCIMSLPVVGSSFANDETAGQWKPGDDFFHLVFIDHSPFEKNYRKQISPDFFDYYTIKSHENVLPVRCFWMPDYPTCIFSDLPQSVASPPVTLKKISEPYFEITETLLYSIHGSKRKNDVFGIGDLLVVLVRN